MTSAPAPRPSAICVGDAHHHAAVQHDGELARARVAQLLLRVGEGHDGDRAQRAPAREDAPEREHLVLGLLADERRRVEVDRVEREAALGGEPAGDGRVDAAREQEQAAARDAHGQAAGRGARAGVDEGAARGDLDADVQVGRVQVDGQAQSRRRRARRRGCRAPSTARGTTCRRGCASTRNETRAPPDGARGMRSTRGAASRRRRRRRWPSRRRRRRAPRRATRGRRRARRARRPPRRGRAATRTRMRPCGASTLRVGHARDARPARCSRACSRSACGCRS